MSITGIFGNILTSILSVKVPKCHRVGKTRMALKYARLIFATISVGLKGLRQLPSPRPLSRSYVPVKHSLT